MNNTSTYSPNSASVSPINSTSSTAAPTATAPLSAGATKTSTAAPQKEDKAEPVKAEPVKEKLANKAQQLGRGLKGMFRLPEQIRRHPLATILGSTGALIVLGGGITVGILESHRRQTFRYRFMKGLRQMARTLSR